MSEAPRAYRGRVPSAPMDAGEVVRLLDLLGAAGVAAWLDGGWGVDALLERQTREHDDLDSTLPQIGNPLARVPDREHP